MFKATSNGLICVYVYINHMRISQPCVRASKFYFGFSHLNIQNGSEPEEEEEEKKNESLEYKASNTVVVVQWHVTRYVKSSRNLFMICASDICINFFACEQA